MPAPEPVLAWLTEKQRDWSRFDQISVAAGVSGVLGALAIIAAGFANFDQLVVPIVFLLLGLLAAVMACWIVRLAQVGRLPFGSDLGLEGRAFSALIIWIVLKFGIVVASAYLWIAAFVGLIVGFRVAVVIDAAVLLALVLVVGNMIQSCAVNLALVFQRRAKAPAADTII